MTNPKVLSGIISKQTHSEKSGLVTDEVDLSRMPNVNIGATYYKNEKHTLRLSMSVPLII